jgi:hypothetical protein
MIKKLLLAASAAATLLGAVAPTAASASPWYHPGLHPGYQNRPGPWHTSSYYLHPGWHGVWAPGWGAWHPGWGPHPGYFAAGVLGVAIGASLAAPYYGPPPAYYAGPGYWGYWEGCRAYWRWSPALGYYVRSNTCY